MGIRTLAIVLATVLVGTGGLSCRTATDLPADQPLQQLESAWGSPYGDLTNRNLSSWAGPDSGDLAWTIAIDNLPTLPAFAGADGQVHVPAGSVLITIGSDGQELWRYQAGDMIRFCQTFGQNWLGLVTCRGNVAVVSENGVEVSTFSTGLESGLNTAAFDPQGILYLSDDGLSAFNTITGKELWRATDIPAGEGTRTITTVGYRVLYDVRPFQVYNNSGDLLWSIDDDERYRFHYKVDRHGYVYQLALTQTDYLDDTADAIRIYDLTGSLIFEEELADRIGDLEQDGRWTYLISQDTIGIYYPVGDNLMLTTIDGSDYYAILDFNILAGQSPRGTLYPVSCGTGAAGLEYRASYGWVIVDYNYEPSNQWMIDIADDGSQIITGTVRYKDELYDGVTLFRPNGRLAWNNPFMPGSFTPLIVAGDGTLVFGTRYALPAPYASFSVIALQSDEYRYLLGRKGNRYYLINNALLAANADGTSAFTFTTSDSITSPAVTDSSGSVYVIDSSGVLYSIDQAGTENWYRLLETGADAGLVLADSGLLLVADTRGIQSFSAMGEPRWQFSPETGHLATPAVSTDGLIVVPGYEYIPNLDSPDSGAQSVSTANVEAVQTDCIYALDLDGKLLWTKPLEKGIGRQPIIDPRGYIYLCPSYLPWASDVICLDSAGNERWRQDLKEYTTTGDTLVLDWCPLPDGHLFVRLDNQIMAIGG